MRHRLATKAREAIQEGSGGWLETVEEQAGQKPSAVLADSGYGSEESLREVAKLGVEAHVAVSRQKHQQVAPPVPARQGQEPRG